MYVISAQQASLSHTGLRSGPLGSLCFVGLVASSFFNSSHGMRCVLLARARVSVRHHLFCCVLYLLSVLSEHSVNGFLGKLEHINQLSHQRSAFVQRCYTVKSRLVSSASEKEAVTIVSRGSVT